MLSCQNPANQCKTLIIKGAYFCLDVMSEPHIYALQYTESLFYIHQTVILLCFIVVLIFPFFCDFKEYLPYTYEHIECIKMALSSMETYEHKRSLLIACQWTSYLFPVKFALYMARWLDVSSSISCNAHPLILFFYNFCALAQKKMR